MCLILFSIFFGTWLSGGVSGAPSDDFESTITTSGGILSLIIIPIVLFTVTCCIKQKKRNSKVIFRKTSEGSFKATVLLPPSLCDTESDKVKNCNVNRDRAVNSYTASSKMTIRTLASDTVTITNPDKLHVHQLSESSADLVTPEGSNTHSNQTLDHKLGSDVNIVPNPSYNVAKSYEGLSDSLYIYCNQQQPNKPPTDIDESSEQQTVNADRKECENNSYGARECGNAPYADDNGPVNPVTVLTRSLSQSGNYDYVVAQNCEELDSTRKKVNPGREECANALYGVGECNKMPHAGDDVPMNRNPSYGITTLARLTSHRELEECDSLYGVTEHNKVTHTSDDVLMNCNPSYGIAAQTRSTSHRKECVNSLYETRENSKALNIGVDAPVNPSPYSITVLTRSTSQDGYDYIAAQICEDSVQQTVNGSREERNNGLYDVVMNSNPSYGTDVLTTLKSHRKKYDNALYGATECDNALHAAGDDVSTAVNPFGVAVMTSSLFQNSYEYIAPQTLDLTEQTNARRADDVPVLTRSTSHRKEHNDALNAARGCGSALYADDDVPVNSYGMTVLTRSTSQNDYDYIPSQNL